MESLGQAEPPALWIQCRTLGKRLSGKRGMLPLILPSVIDSSEMSEVQLPFVGRGDVGWEQLVHLRG